MSFDTDLDYFRVRQAEQFTTTVTVTRSTGDVADTAVTDPLTGAVDVTDETVYMGVCKIKPAETVGSDQEVGDRQVRLVGFIGRFPVDTDLRIDDVVIVTASEHDAGLVDKVFVVTDVLLNEWQICRNVTLELGPRVVAEVGS